MGVKKIATIALAAGVLALSSGCASMMSGTTQDILVKSDPPGARIYIDDDYRGITPYTITLDRGSRPVITVVKDGYKPVKIEPTKSMNPWNFGNVATASLGAYVDMFTGAGWKFDKDELDVNLVTITPDNPYTGDEFETH